MTWLTLDEVVDYADADPASVMRAVARGRLGVPLLDPWDAASSLVARHTVDGWWRERKLARR